MAVGTSVIVPIEFIDRPKAIAEMPEPIRKRIIEARQAQIDMETARRLMTVTAAASRRTRAHSRNRVSRKAGRPATRQADIGDRRLRAGLPEEGRILRGLHGRRRSPLFSPSGMRWQASQSSYTTS